MRFFTPLVFGASLVAAAPLTSRNPAAINAPGDRLSVAEVEALRKTCWGGTIEKLPAGMPQPLKPTGQGLKQLKVWSNPDSKANTITIHNYCSYPIYYTNVNQQKLLTSGTLQPKGKFEAQIQYEGMAFKASKNKNMGNDMLVEYSLAKDGQLWYNLSLITCLTKEAPFTGQCAGFEGGMQFGNKDFSFQCAGGKWCDDQAYFYKENMCKGKDNPVKTCAANKGVTMEFCANNRSK